MKANRQDKIIEIIQQNDIETQEELAHLLAAAGFHVTQATISRDIRALHLEKIPDGKGGSNILIHRKKKLTGKNICGSLKMVTPISYRQEISW